MSWGRPRAMKHVPLSAAVVLALAGCSRSGAPSQGQPVPGPAGGSSGPPASLVEVRKAFTTKIVRRESAKEPGPQPPPRLFPGVRYEPPAGRLAAYLSPDPKDGQKDPARHWIP